MSADELEAARAELENARELATGETEERLANLVEKVDGALENGRTLDHGALAGMTRTLAELEENESGDAAEAIDAASEALTTYREGVPGA